MVLEDGTGGGGAGTEGIGGGGGGGGGAGGAAAVVEGGGGGGDCERVEADGGKEAEERAGEDPAGVSGEGGVLGVGGPWL